MNFITTNHRGGLGNVMFKLSAAISLAIDNNIEYIFSKEFIRPNIDPDYGKFYDNILRNIKFIDRLPSNYTVHRERQFSYSEIKYTRGTNLLLDGYFQSEEYFINNKKTIIDIFRPTENIKKSVLSDLPDVNSYVSVHIRRGDYLNFPDHHPQQSPEYFRSASELIGIDKTHLIFSDDIESVKGMFDYLPNKIFYTSGRDWLDLYTMSMCGDNIICNSTFSWWGAYLNMNKNKKVIANSKWFGPAYIHHSTASLFPKEWIVINK